MQRYCMDIGVSRLVRCQLGGVAQFANRLLELLAPDQCQTERVVNPRILWNCSRRGAKDALAVGFAPHVPIEVGEVDCCRRVLLAQPKRGSVLSFRVGKRTTPSVERSEHGASFWSIGVEPLCCDELLPSSPQTLTLCRGELGLGNAGKNESGSDAYT